MSRFSNHATRSTVCPFCFRPIDFDSCPVIAQNYTSGASMDPDMMRSAPDLAPPDRPLPPPAGRPADQTPSGARPVSGAETFGQVGPYPILFDPTLPRSGARGSLSSLLGAERPQFDPSDRPTRACRRCEMPLPERLDQVDVFTIAVVGTQYSGKSHFLTALGNELLQRQRLHGLGLGAVRPVGTTARTFHRRYLRVYEDLLAHARTTEADGASAARQPFAFEMASTNGRARMVLLHDVPGEWLMDANRRAEYFPFLRHADGVIFLIDPMGLPAVRRQLSSQVDSRHFVGREFGQQQLLDELADELGSRARTIPTSIVISKGDCVEQAFGPMPKFHQPEPPNAADFDRSITDLDRAVRSDVLPLLDHPAIAVAAQRFPTAVYHMISQIGSTPEYVPGEWAAEQRITEPIQPWRVLDPLYRLLTE